MTAGETDFDRALKIIRQTRQQADTVRRLLRALGDTDETRALTKRFQRVQRRAESGQLPAGLDAETAYDRFAELTLAVHALDLRLRTKFYPLDRSGPSSRDAHG